MNNEDKEEELKKEAEEFGDICRVSLLDSYEGLVHKVTKSISCLESYQGLVLIMDQPTFTFKKIFRIIFQEYKITFAC